MRVYCDKCCKVLNFYPNRDKKGEIINWTAKRCEHKISNKYVKEHKVVVKWFLANGKQLISKEPVKRWIVK